MPTELPWRWRIVFGIDGPLSYASVLDLGRLWERLLRRAGVRLAYSQGFNPHPRMQFAAALAVGYTSSAEVLDIWATQEWSADALFAAIKKQAPTGLTILRVLPVAYQAPSPQAALTSMAYRIEIESVAASGRLQASVAETLARSSLVIERTRKGQSKPFDLRPLVLDLRYIGFETSFHILEMELAFRADGSVRPEEVLAALGITDAATRIHRTALNWEGMLP